MRLTGSEAQVFEVGQAIGLLGELDVFTPLRIRGFDLSDCVAQVIGFTRAPVLLGDEHVELALR